MHYSNQPIEGAWSGSGKLAALLAAGAIAAASFAAMRPIRLPLSALAIGAAAMIGGVVVLSRCRIPAVVKGALIVTASGTWLMLIATQDGLGLRTVNVQTSSVLAEANAAAVSPALHPAAPTRITADDPLAQAAARDASRAVDAQRAAGDVAVTGDLSATGSGLDRSYRLNWALVRGDERAWCGIFTEMPRATRPDFAGFAQRAAQAADRSRGKALDCE